MIKSTTGFNNTTRPKGPANMRSNKHPPRPIKAANPVAILLTRLTIISIILIKTSNMAETVLAIPYNIFPAIFFNIFMYY